jgi:hypothetical protein
MSGVSGEAAFGRRRIDIEQTAGGSTMNSERADAYRRVMTTLREVGPSKLTAGEQSRIREAADALLFSASLNDDPTAWAALDDVHSLARVLQDSDRWTELSVRRLLDDITDCGPGLAPAVSRAA